MTVTLQPSYSFYVGASSEDAIRIAADYGDAITIGGPSGPSTIAGMRRHGFEKPVLFDGEGYKGKNPASMAAWMQAQQVAGADRLLTIGCLANYDKDKPGSWAPVVAAEIAHAASWDATALIAIDARILAREYDLLVSVLDVDVTVALVLAHNLDPLSVPGAVENLRRLIRALTDLSLLRSDHGAMSVPAFGGAHASIGLRTGTRHLWLGGGGGKNTNMSRVYTPLLWDWFTADVIAGWAVAARPFIHCPLGCCGGASLDRFFNRSIDVAGHNMTALAVFADLILNADPADRPRVFLDHVHEAHDRYAQMGLFGPKSKAQLNSWALL